jgi:hypothetical protein
MSARSSEDKDQPADLAALMREALRARKAGNAGGPQGGGEADRRGGKVRGDDKGNRHVRQYAFRRS